jgi:RNA recognition motif-containing protein
MKSGLSAFSILPKNNAIDVIVAYQKRPIAKGYGFITMNDDAGAQRAIDALNGTIIRGRTISVRLAEKKQATVQLPIKLRIPAGITRCKASDRERISKRSVFSLLRLLLSLKLSMFPSMRTYSQPTCIQVNQILIGTKFA